MLPVVKIFNFEFPTFYFILSLIVSVLFILAFRQARQRHLDLHHFFNITLILFLGSFVGSRLMHVIYEEPSYYAQNVWRIFYFWQGGFVFYGGFITCFLLGWIYCQRQKISFFEQADFFSPYFALAYAGGRMGCFANGCCYGKACDLPWSIKGRHPAALYAVFLELLIFVFLIFLQRKKTKVGEIFLSWVVLHSVARIVMEYFRDDDRGAFVLGLSISTWMSLGIAIAALLTLQVSQNEKI